MSLSIEQSNSRSSQSGFFIRDLTVNDSEKGPISIYHSYSLKTDIDTPGIIVAPGWGEGHETLSAFSRAIVEDGRNSYTFNHHRHKAAHSDPEAYKSSTLGAVFDEALADNGNTPLTIVAHSEGAISAVRLAAAMVKQNRSREIRAIQLVAPAGITDVTSAPRLLKRASSEVVGHRQDIGLIRSLGYRSLLQVARYTIPHPRLGIAELRAIATTDTREDIEAIAAAGVPVGVLGCLQDKIFPISEMRRNCMELPVEYDEVDSTHVQFFARKIVQSRVLSLAAHLEMKNNPNNHNLIDNVVDIR